MRKFVVISLLLHGFLLFIFLFHIQHHPELWSGGYGQKEGVVTIVLQGEEGKEKSENGKQDMGTKKQKLQIEKPSTIHHPPSTAGQGTSPTPAGGKGAGFDAGVTSAEPDILQQIRQRILRVKEYPLQARRRGLQGAVGLTFNLLPDGNVGQVRVVQSSGVPLLDDEAVATVKRASPYPFYSSDITLSLKFDLNE